MLTLVGTGGRQSTLVVHGGEPTPAVVALSNVEESHRVESFSTVKSTNHVDTCAKGAGRDVAITNGQILQEATNNKAPILYRARALQTRR